MRTSSTPSGFPATAKKKEVRKKFQISVDELLETLHNLASLLMTQQTARSSRK